VQHTVALFCVCVCEREIRGPSFSSRCDSKVYSVSFRSMGIIWEWEVGVGGKFLSNILLYL